MPFQSRQTPLPRIQASPARRSTVPVSSLAMAAWYARMNLMRVRLPSSIRIWQSAGLALILWLAWPAAARADDELFADFNGDGRADRVSIATVDQNRLRL